MVNRHDAYLLGVKYYRKTKRMYFGAETEGKNVCHPVFPALTDIY